MGLIVVRMSPLSLFSTADWGEGAFLWQSRMIYFNYFNNLSSYFMKQTIKGSLHTVLFGGRTPERSERVCRVENLNEKRKVFSTMRKVLGKTEYTVCLCMTNNRRVVSTKLYHKQQAEELMEKYRQLYSEK